MTAIDWSVRAVTFSVVVPLILDKVAVMFADPVAMGVANPPVLIVATAVFEDRHVTLLVTLFVLPSE